MTRTTIKGLLLASSILGSAGLAHAQDVTLTIESWRNDDLAIWQEKLIPAFEAKSRYIEREGVEKFEASWNELVVDVKQELEAAKATG